MEPRRRRLAVVLAIALTGVLAAELVLRALDLPGPLQRTDLVESRWRGHMDFGSGPGSYWRLAPARGPWLVNAQGLRGYTPEPPGDADLRIAVLGAGSAFGVDVEQHQTFTARLERAAQRELPHGRVQTLLAALPDWSSHQFLEAWTQAVAPFAPHVVVVHSEPWNDAATAVGPSDAELALAPSRRPGLHLLALLWNDPHPGGGPRVDLDRYRTNLRALLTAARDAGADVLVTLPAVGAKTNARSPKVADYVAAQRDLAVALRCTVIDCHAFAVGLEQAAAGVACSDVGETHAFRDGVHLSVPGHALLAEVLLSPLRTTRRFQVLAAAPGPPALPAVQRVEPDQVPALAAAEVLVQGTGFAAPGPLRAHAGGELATVLGTEGGDRLRLRLPERLPPGVHDLELVTPRGACRLERALTVGGAELQATLQRRGDRLHLAAAGRAPAGSSVQIWLAPGARTQPIATHAGDFWLQHAVHEDRKRDAMFCWSALTLPSATAIAAADGTWRLEADLDRPTLMPMPTVALQGAIWLTGRPGPGIATAVLVAPVQG